MPISRNDDNSERAAVASLAVVQLGDPRLRRISTSAADLSEALRANLLEALSVTLQTSGGVGIAAPQVGEAIRAVIVASKPNARYPHAPSMEPLVLLDPVVEWASPETEVDWEGCLSVPGIRGRVVRSSRIRVRYRRASDLGEVVEEFEGFVARIAQHEIDHLDGLVFLDRVPDTRDLATEQEYRRIVSESVASARG